MHQKKYLALLFLSLLTEVLFAQTLAKGVVTDRIAVNDSLQETYAVYLPEDFNMSQQYPALFVFDPQGQGQAAARLLKPVAASFGALVIASNTAIPDSLNTALEMGRRVLQDAYNRFPVDQNQIFTIGLNTGGGLASALASYVPEVRGLLAINEVLLNEDALRNLRQKEVVLYAGDEVVAFYDLENLRKFFKRFGIDNSLYMYDGGQNWPSSEMLSIGATHLLLNKDSLDQRQIQQYYRSDLDAADQQVRKQHYLVAERVFDNLKDKYDGLTDISELKEAQRTLKRYRAFRKARNAYRNLEEEEDFLREDFIYYHNNDVAQAEFENLGWWNVQMAELDRKISESKKPQEVKSAKRLKSTLERLNKFTLIQLKKEPNTLHRQLFVNILRTLVDPKDYEGFLGVISLTSRLQDYGSALFYTEELLKNGFTDYEALYALEGTSALELTKDYNTLIKRYLGKSKYFD
ncbi:hypothetical protein [Croceiramulus getboli]|nr:hypothetical protein P8624_08155 [Flavobacteriaceae bacterium YJPT1-3]